MKKITCGILSLFLLFTVSGCSLSRVNDDALDALDIVITNFTLIPSTDFVVETEYKTGENSEKGKMNGSLDNNQGSLSFSMEGDKVKDGENMDLKGLTNAFLLDDFIYYTVGNDTKQKIAFDMNLLTSLRKSGKKSLALKDTGIKEFLAVAEDDNGRITLEFDEKKINNLVQAMGKVKESGMFKDMGESEITNVKVTVDSKDRLLNYVEASFDVKGVPGLKDGSISMKISLENVYNGKEITYPDLKGYPEGDLTDLLNAFKTKK